VCRLLNLFIFILFLSVPLCATPIRASISGYTVPISYNKVVNKLDQTVVGGYGYLGWGVHSLEGEYDALMSGSSVSQHDVTAIYTYYGLPATRLRFGTHIVDSTSTSGKGVSLILGFDYDYIVSKYRHWTVGGDVFLTLHQTNSGDLFVGQISPYVSVPLPIWPVPGLITTVAKVNMSMLSRDVGFGTNPGYSIENMITYDLYPFRMSLYGWVGKTVYGFWSRGFILHNLVEQHLRGAGVDASLALTPQVGISVGYAYQEFLQGGQSVESSLSKWKAMFTVSL